MKFSALKQVQKLFIKLKYRGIKVELINQKVITS